MIARNPIKQMISWVTDGYKEYIESLNTYAWQSLTLTNKNNINNVSLEQWMHKYIIHHDSNKNIGYKAISNQCKQFNNKFSLLGNNHKHYNHDQDWMNQEYKIFVGKYLYQTKVLNSIFGKDSHDRQETFFEVTVLFPALLMFIYNYDETFGLKNWNNFRLIQYEWLYYNSKTMMDGLTIIKCWLQMNNDLKYTYTFDFKDINVVDQSFDKCSKVFHENKNYYNQLKNIFNKTKENKVKHWSMKNDVDARYKKFFVNFYQPCVESLLILIEHRREVVMGSWLPWPEWSIPKLL